MEFVLLVTLLLTAIIAYLYAGTKKNGNVKPAPKITQKPKTGNRASAAISSDPRDWLLMVSSPSGEPYMSAVC
ncbi:hypothetical protein V9T40_007719 [Parthenolecanium corni]|uniref:Uncharacterized protein n=1 Tax=Parthenolecanium corni TaxID=536013 RepID=A0AAN9TJX1_9HEMI